MIRHEPDKTFKWKNDGYKGNLNCKIWNVNKDNQINCRYLSDKKNLQKSKRNRKLTYHNL